MIEVIGVSYVVIYLVALAWGWSHQSDPFWQGFVNPFGIGR
jgi:hypothetical protein